MSITTLPTSCYLVEWYQPALTGQELDQFATQIDRYAAAMSADGSRVRLMLILAVPTDDVVFALFAATSEHLVTEACRLAGIPAQRLTAAIATGSSG